MQEYFSHIAKLVKEQSFFLVAFVYLIAIALWFKTSGGRKVIRLIRSRFLYSESSDDANEKLFSMIQHLEVKMMGIEKELSSNILKNKQQVIDKEIDRYLDQNLHDIIRKKVVETTNVEDSVMSELEERISREVTAHLASSKIDDLVKGAERVLHQEMRKCKNDDLDSTIREQLRSAGRIKTVMINLFIFFNIGVIVVYALGGANLSQHAIYAITSLYVSLAMFIFYIYRTSNFRTAVLLALREDGKKLFDVFYYLDKFKSRASLTSTDIEIVKMMLINRSERERVADHPYEVVLKGITNSNVQFKGGRINLKEDKSRS